MSGAGGGMKHKWLGILLAVLFVPIFILCFVLYNLKTTFLSANFYKSEFRKINLYSELVENIPELIGGFAADEQSQEFARIAQESIKADWLQGEVEKNLDNIFEWFYGKKENFIIEVNLVPIKGEFEKKFFEQMEKEYNSLPECTGSESEMSSESTSGWELETVPEDSATPFSCRPQGATFEEFQKEIMADSGEDNPFNEFPDNYKFEKTAQEMTIPGAPSFLAGSPFKVFNWVFYILLFLTVGILALIGIMARKSLRSLFRWIGIPLAIPSFFLLAVSIVGRVGINSFSSSSLYPVDPSVEFTGISQIADSLIRSMIINIGNKKLIESGMIFFIAIILIIISFFFKKTEPVSGQAQPEAKQPPATPSKTEQTQV